MVTRTYLSQSNTIISGSNYNFGLNPTADLFYGNEISRFIFQFDVSNIQSLVNNKTYPDISKLTHKLHFYNCGSIAINGLKDGVYANFPKQKERTSSFDLILFPIPQDWDGGNGFDYPNNGLSCGEQHLSTNASNWYNATTASGWTSSNGIYSTDYLAQEYDKFLNNQDSIIINKYHFNLGIEDLDIDLTDIINSQLISGSTDNGYCLCFSPDFESLTTDILQYVGFFNQNTPFFYEPYIETIYNDVISDDRAEFYLDKVNRLYLYANIGGNVVNLDQLPACTILDQDEETILSTPQVNQVSKGVYYIEYSLPSSGYTDNRMYYDQWSNIIYNNQTLNNITLDFTTKKPENYFSIGYDSYKPKDLIPAVYGIKQGEKIIQGDVRHITVDCRIPFTSNKYETIKEVYYRLYVKKTNNEEVTVIDYQQLNKTPIHNYFLLDTLSLLPNKYYIDIKINSNLETKYYKETLQFEILNID